MGAGEGERERERSRETERDVGGGRARLRCLDASGPCPTCQSTPAALLLSILEGGMITPLALSDLGTAHTLHMGTCQPASHGAPMPPWPGTVEIFMETRPEGRCCWR